MNKISKLILIFVLTVALCWSLVVGSTYALFEDENTTNISVSSGILTVTYSMPITSTYFNDGNEVQMGWLYGGKYSFDSSNGELTLTNIVPGCGIKLDIYISNIGSLAAKWQVKVEADAEFFEQINLSTEGGVDFVGKYDTYFTTSWERIDAQADQDLVSVVSVFFEFPHSSQLPYFSGTAIISVNAVQANAQID
ncbi:MAG: hypothetical protein J1F68_00605 [Clostridiales bacterium]|nr:hypothetical protein [Clostridiales bacterium]